MEKIGYARVSTQGQSLESQLLQLSEFGCAKVFREKVSGARSERPQLRYLLSTLEPHSTLVVTRLDRLARSTLDLLQILQSVSSKQATFLSLAEPWASTATPLGKLMLTVLGGLAEFERSLISTRTADGRERARKAGVKFGPKFKLTRHQIEEIKNRRELGESCRFLARSYGVSPNTISRVR